MKYVLYLILFMVLIGTIQATAYEKPYAWMEPEHPTDKDHISLYCRAPGAYDVRFTLCDDDSGLCYMLMNQTKIDSQTWKIDVYGTLKAGTRAHYEITVVYRNESTGNESTVKLEPVHFEVTASPGIPADESPSLGLAFTVSVVAISSVLWRMRRRD